MPFTKSSRIHAKNYWTKHFNTFLKPLIEEIPSIEAHRSEALRGDILKQIITDLVVSPIVVADLTDHNPNVYWELGVRQSFKHNTITIAEEGTQLPFDISSKGTLFYTPKDHLKMQEFRKQFKKAIKDCISNPDKPDSHVLETISGRGSLYEIIRHEESKRRLEALLSEINGNIDYLKYVYNVIEKEKTIPTARFRASAVELLITHRYLDLNSKFYKLTENYFDMLIQLNDQLRLLEEENKDNTIEYLKKLKKVSIEIFNKFKEEIKNIYEKFKKRIF